MTESIKSKMDRAFKIRNDNRLALAIEDEIKKIDVMRELRELSIKYHKKEISDNIAKETIEMMLSLATVEQIEEVYLRIIWDRQMSDEQKEKSTKYRNGIGFNSIDAPFASSLMKQIENGHSLSVKQVQAAKKILLKYWIQMLDVY